MKMKACLNVLGKSTAFYDIINTLTLMKMNEKVQKL